MVSHGVFPWPQDLLRTARQREEAVFTREEPMAPMGGDLEVVEKIMERVAKSIHISADPFHKIWYIIIYRFYR